MNPILGGDFESIVQKPTDKSQKARNKSGGSDRPMAQFFIWFILKHNRPSLFEPENLNQDILRGILF